MAIFSTTLQKNVLPPTPIGNGLMQAVLAKGVAAGTSSTLSITSPFASVVDVKAHVDGCADPLATLICTNSRNANGLLTLAAGGLITFALNTTVAAECIVSVLGT